MSILHRDLTFRTIGIAMEVHRKLGAGFLEKVYENAMMVLFKREKIQAIQQAPIDVIFENEFDRLFWWQTPIAVLKPKF